MITLSEKGEKPVKYLFEIGDYVFDPVTSYRGVVVAVDKQYFDQEEKEYRATCHVRPIDWREVDFFNLEYKADPCGYEPPGRGRKTAKERKQIELDNLSMITVKIPNDQLRPLRLGPNVL